MYLPCAADRGCGSTVGILLWVVPVSWPPAFPSAAMPAEMHLTAAALLQQDCSPTQRRTYHTLPEILRRPPEGSVSSASRPFKTLERCFTPRTTYAIKSVGVHLLTYLNQLIAQRTYSLLTVSFSPPALTMDDASYQHTLMLSEAINDVVVQRKFADSHGDRVIPSAVTPKPAIGGHPKPGQWRRQSGRQFVIPYPA